MDYAAARSNMVESQLRTNKVFDPRLLDAFAALPRERFVPAQLRGIAYVDEDLPIGHGRHLMEPMVLARLIQAAAVEPGDVALDVGCGPGYSAALLARLAGTVVALESEPLLSEQALRLLGELEIDNAVVIDGELTAGYREQAPYNVILIAGAVAEMPSALTEQLADGGRLVTVKVDDEGVGRGVLVRRDGDAISDRVLFDAATPILPGFERKPSFVF